MKDRTCGMGEAVSQRVRMADGCGWFWRVGGEDDVSRHRRGDGTPNAEVRVLEPDACVARAGARVNPPNVEAGIDRRMRGLIPIYTDEEGDYCKIPLTHGHFIKVDPEDYCWVSQFRWHYVRTSRTFYAVRSDYADGRGRKIWLHREIMGTPKGLVCDHVNHNGLDDRKHNLRNCTVAQNNLNRQRYRNSRGRYKGVWWCKTMQMWGSEIQAAGEAEFLGYFVHEVQAARAYDAAARRLHGEFAFLNFPEETAGGGVRVGFKPARAEETKDG